jgi:DNA-binding transcriptional ArsR family regulator
MAEDVIVLEPGEERAQRIAKAIGSPMAGEILQLLKDGPKTSTQIIESLSIPMSTAKYHIENLLNAGILEVAETKYSVKGREVKVYRLRDQVVVVAPRTPDVRSILLRYASLFGIVAVATAVIAGFQALSMARTATTYQATKEAATWNGAGAVSGSPGNITLTVTVPAPSADVVSRVSEQVTSAIPVPVGPVQPAVEIVPPAIMFLLGGCLVIVLLLCWDLYQRRRT